MAETYHDKDRNYTPNFLKAKAKEFKRTGGICRFCGQRAAMEAHHWADKYPRINTETADDLSAMCRICHGMMTELRRFQRAGGSVFQFKATLENAIAECDIESPSRELAPSSCTTERQDWTRDPLPTSKRRKSQGRKEATEQRQTTSDCATSNVKPRFGSTRAGRLQSRKRPSRAVIENGARKLKQGPQVREGLIVEKTEKFQYDKKLGKTVEEVGEKAQFTVGVVVQRARILRTRAKFDEWACTFVVEVDDELVDKPQLEQWLDIGGRRIGLGDWRPQKSGHYGRFEVKEIKAI